MRTAALTFLSFVACLTAANAQRFSLLPQVGFENSKTGISYNDGAFFAPEGVKFSPQASLRLNYASRQGHGFFIGLASSRSLITYQFADPETGMNNFSATAGDMQFRLEGGYQFSSKPLYFSRPGKTATAPKSNAAAGKQCGPYRESSCSKSSYSSLRHCGSNKNESKQSTQNRSWVKLQPFLGMGFIPAVKTDLVTKASAGQPIHEYQAGNWRTALVTGAGFEFGNNKNSLFTLSLQYFKGIGNLQAQTLHTVSGNKSISTRLDSEVSGWSLRAGIPFTLGKAKHTAKHKPMMKKPGCQPYRIQYRCRTRMI